MLATGWQGEGTVEDNIDFRVLSLPFDPLNRVGSISVLLNKDVKHAHIWVSQVKSPLQEYQGQENLTWPGSCDNARTLMSLGHRRSLKVQGKVKWRQSGSKCFWDKNTPGPWRLPVEKPAAGTGEDYKEGTRNGCRFHTSIPTGELEFQVQWPWPAMDTLKGQEIKGLNKDIGETPY